MTFHLSALRQDIKLMTFSPINIKHVHVGNVLHHNLNKETEDILQMLLPFHLQISNCFRQALNLHFKIYIYQVHLQAQKSSILHTN